MDKNAKKQILILSKAKEVFIKKGFTAVTMKDIIEECGISRGGIYLYFQSVDEIFIQVMKAHNEQKLKESRSYIDKDKSFAQLIDGYFAKHKKRIMNINHTLLFAVYEFRFAHKDDYDKEFFLNQFLHTKTIVLELLMYGVKKGDISAHKIDDLAMNIVFLIEGMGMLGTAAGISEELIDQQIDFIKQRILSHKNQEMD